MAGVQPTKDGSKKRDVDSEEGVTQIEEDPTGIDHALAIRNLDSSSSDTWQTSNISLPNPTGRGTEMQNSDTSSSDSWPTSDISLTTKIDYLKGLQSSDSSSSNTCQSSDISLPTMSTIYNCPFLPTLTSLQILSSFPTLQHPGSNLPYKCAKCCHFYSTEETLVAHVQEGVNGDFSCRRFYQKWRQFREDHKQEKRKSLEKQRFPRFSGLRIFRKKKEGDDKSI